MTVHIPSALRSYTAQRGEIEVDASTLADALSRAGGSVVLPAFKQYAGRGADGKTLYIVDSRDNQILTAKMPVAGKMMYSHM